MKRPVAHFLRLIVIGVAAAATLAVSACSPATTTPIPAPATSVAKQPISQPPATGAPANDVVPVSTQCNQDTRPPYVPDNSGFALLPGGGSTIQVIYAKAEALKARGTNDGILFDGMPIIDITSSKELAALSQGVMCPDGHVYVNGDPNALIANARLINEDSNGVSAKPHNAGTFSHVASEVLQAPCPAIIRVFPHSGAVKTFGFQAVCKNSGALYDLGFLYPQTLK